MQVAAAALNRLLFICVGRTANLHLRIYVFTDLLSLSNLEKKNNLGTKNPPTYDKVMQRLLH